MNHKEKLIKAYETLFSNWQATDLERNEFWYHCTKEDLMILIKHYGLDNTFMDGT